MKSKKNQKRGEKMTEFWELMMIILIMGLLLFGPDRKEKNDEKNKE